MGFTWYKNAIRTEHSNQNNATFIEVPRDNNNSLLELICHMAITFIGLINTYIIHNCDFHSTNVKPKSNIPRISNLYTIIISFKYHKGIG